MAMQRPSDELFDSIMLIEAFQCNGITAVIFFSDMNAVISLRLSNVLQVINLCEPGEHPYCGFPLKSSGFPYTPERLMGAGSMCDECLEILTLHNENYALCIFSSQIF